MEPRFGHGFGHVRVHTVENAVESARAVNALAYTVGRNVVFDEMQYEPSTPGGRCLIAHELTHVVQQPPATPTGIQIAPTHDVHEQEATRSAQGLDRSDAHAHG